MTDGTLLLSPQGPRGYKGINGPVGIPGPPVGIYTQKFTEMHRKTGVLVLRFFFFSAG